jgi:hypothetical protein
VYNVTLMPPNATTRAVINATERGNFTVNNLPNELSINQGQGLIMTGMTVVNKKLQLSLLFRLVEQILVE